MKTLIKALCLVALTSTSVAHANETADRLRDSIPASPRSPLPLPSQPRENLMDIKNMLSTSHCDLVHYNNRGEIIDREEKISRAAFVLGGRDDNGSDPEKVLETLAYKLPNGGTMFLKIKAVYDHVGQTELHLAEVPGSHEFGPEGRTFMIRAPRSNDFSRAILVETTNGSARLMNFKNDAQLVCQFMLSN